MVLYLIASINFPFLEIPHLPYYQLLIFLHLDQEINLLRHLQVIIVALVHLNLEPSLGFLLPLPALGSELDGQLLTDDAAVACARVGATC